MSRVRATPVTYAALLRAVNVGGRKVAMAELRALCEELGYGEPRTVLQSGNVVFTSAAPQPSLAPQLEAAIAKRFGVETTVFVRNGAEWSEIVERNPLRAAAKDDPSHLVALVMNAPPADRALDRLRAVIVGRERVEIAGACAYAWYRDGIGESKLTNTLIERHLSVRVTGRNWNTVRKLAEATALQDDSSSSES